MSREALAKPLKADMREPLITSCICTYIYIYINKTNKQ